MDILAELDVLGLLSGLNLVADNLVSYLEGIKWNLPDTYYEKIDSNRITRVQYYNGKQYLASRKIVRSYSADLLIEQKPGWKMEKQLSYGFPSREDDEVIIRVTNKHNRWVYCNGKDLHVIWYFIHPKVVFISNDYLRVVSDTFIEDGVKYHAPSMRYNPNVSDAERCNYCFTLRKSINACDVYRCGHDCDVCFAESDSPEYQTLYDMDGAVLVEGNLELTYAFNEVAPDPGNPPKFLHDLMNPKPPTLIERVQQHIQAFLSWP